MPDNTHPDHSAAGGIVIHSTTLTPSKEEIISAFMGRPRTVIGSWRLADPEGHVGIEGIISRADKTRFEQVPVSYRSEELDPEHTLATTEHGVLGTRYVTNAHADAVAVREILRLIIEGGDGPAWESSKEVMTLHSVGSENLTWDPDSVTIDKTTSQHCYGHVNIGGQLRSFKLYTPRNLTTANYAVTGH